MINSVLKALDIMQSFSTIEPRLSLKEISSKLTLPKSTTHSLLKTLQSRGFIEQTDDGRYSLGTSVISLTQSVRVNVELRDRSAPLLRQLADSVRASAYLTVREDDKVVYVYAVESPQRLQARTAVGDRGHMHSTSVGKAILSVLPESEVLGILSRTGLPQFTDCTITRVEDLMAELVESRRRGYALDRGENEENTYCVGAPIFDDRGRVIGACSISGADPEIAQRRAPEFASRVMPAAQEASRRMGYVPSRMSDVAWAEPVLQEAYQR